MKKIYVLSGLGADERVFQFIDFTVCSITFIEWIKPLQNESIETYAYRLAQQIKDDNPILIGLSFGGMMAIEIAKQIMVEKIILISSAKSMFEIPFYYRFFGKIRLHKLLPASLLKSSNSITNWIFGVQNQFEKKLLKSVLADTDSDFLKWAIDKIARWKNTTLLKNILHIHGNCDHILPHFFVKANFVVEGGGHLMTLNKPEEINKFLKIALEEVQNIG